MPCSACGNSTNNAPNTLKRPVFRQPPRNRPVFRQPPKDVIYLRPDQIPAYRAYMASISVSKSLRTLKFT
jgi:hypothetical protein